MRFPFPCGHVFLKQCLCPLDVSVNSSCPVYTTGPYVTDIRIVRTTFLMEPIQPYMEALRKAGFSVVFRPNKIVGGAFLFATTHLSWIHPCDDPPTPIPPSSLPPDLFPLPAPTKYRAEFAIVASVGDGKVAPRLASLQLSSKAPGASGLSGNVLSELELFNDGYSPLPEELGMFKLDPGNRLWMKWNTQQELTNVGQPRRRPVGTDVFALAKGAEVDLSYTQKQVGKKISKVRAKRETITTGGKSGTGSGSDTQRSGATGIGSPGSVSGAGSVMGSPVSKLQPIGERPSKLASPLNPTFVRRGLVNVARDEVTTLARGTSVGQNSAPPPQDGDFSGGAKRIWGTPTGQLRQSTMKLVPLAAFDKKAMARGVEPDLQLESLSPPPQTLRTGEGMSINTGRSTTSRMSFGSPTALSPVTPARKLNPLNAREGRPSGTGSLRSEGEPVRLRDYEAPAHKVVPQFQPALPHPDDRALLDDSRLTQLEFFGACSPTCLFAVLTRTRGAGGGHVCM